MTQIRTNKNWLFVGSLMVTLVLSFVFGANVLAQTAGMVCPNGSPTTDWALCSTGPSGSDSTGSGSTGSSSPSQETTCATGGGKWCGSSGGGSSWCSYSSSPCPAYDAASCSAQSGEWCANQSGGGGWCASGPNMCPIYDSASCSAKGRNWCNSTGGGMGWCAMSGSVCPAYDSASCSLQGGEWCAPTGGSSSYGGWCNSTKGNCPAPAAPTPSPVPTPTPMPISSPTPAMSNWPNTETVCKKYKGVWCESTGSMAYGSSMMNGSCNMAGTVCYTPAPSNMMRCWDDSLVAMGQSCGAMPYTSADCTNKGGRWCKSSYSGSSGESGWCSSKNMVCPMSSPSGKMVCPDNETAVNSLSECPTVQEAPKPEITKPCPDGSNVPLASVCPEKKDDTISVCLKKGGTWCIDPTGKASYCDASPNATCKSRVMDEEKKEKEVPFTEQQKKNLEERKSILLKRIDGLDRIFKKFKDLNSLIRTSALKEKINALTMDAAGQATLDRITDDLAVLKEIKDALLDSGEITEPSEQDRLLQEAALQKLKRQITTFTKQLTTIKLRIESLRKNDFLIPKLLDEAVNQSEDLLKTINEAKTYDEARDASEALSDQSDEVNVWMPKLEQLSRIMGMTKMMNQEVSKREKEFKKTMTLVTRSKLDLAEFLSGIEQTIADVKTAVAGMKQKDFSDEDPFDYVQEQIIDKLENIDNALANAKSVINLRVSLNQVKTKISSYETKIKRLEKLNKDSDEMRPLLEELKDSYLSLQSLMKKTLTAEDTYAAVKEMNMMKEVMSQLDDLLQLSIPTVLEKELTKLKRAAIPRIDTPELQKLVVQTYRMADFIRRPPQLVAGYKIINKSN